MTLVQVCINSALMYEHWLVPLLWLFSGGLTFELQDCWACCFSLHMMH
jgi:hypothetical protein